MSATASPPATSSFAKGLFLGARSSTLLDQVARNDDATIRSVARLADKRGEDGYELAKVSHHTTVRS